MLSKNFPFLFFLSLLIFPVSCAKEPILPQSFQGEVLRIVDPSRVELMVTGIGEEFEWAEHDAQKAGMARIVQDLVQSAEEKERFSYVQERFYKEYKKYVERWELKGRKKRGDGTIEVKGVVVLNRRLMEDDLIGLGVIKERRERLELLEYPTIALLPETSSSEPPWLRFVWNHGLSYLTQRKYDVIDIEQLKKVEAMAGGLKEIEGLPTDPKAIVALQAGADIYVVFEIRLDRGRVGSDATVKASCGVKAYETTTARQVGASSGFSQEYPATAGAEEKAVAEAMGDALDRVLTNIEDYWKDDLKRGHQFLITIQGDFRSRPELRRGLVEIIRSVTKGFKEEISTDRTLNYRVWYSGSNTDLLFSLQDAWKGKFKGELKEVTTTRKLLVLRVGG
jgi:hypothetical protein